MKQGLRLYIMGEQVDLSSQPDILYNYVVDDIMNPSVVRNSFSKTISIPGTDRNNRIFNQYWNLERINFEEGFRANRKNTFSIYKDSTLYETGYCKLDKITRNLGKITYQLSLFGGLGDFLYSLAYADDASAGEGQQKKLSDLIYRYGKGGEIVDFDFTINKETVKEAWDNIDSDSSKWGFLNFAPAYNGLPSDFDANKVLINVQGTTQPSSGTRPSSYARRQGMSIITATTVDGSAFTAYNGYVLAEMDSEKVESEMREFRSYLQRPVFRVKEIINACCNPENNGGYTVHLDPDFFNSENPYWEESWVTLPMLTSFDYVGSTESETATATLELPATGTTTSGYWEDRRFAISEHESTRPMQLTVDFDLEAVLSSNPGVTLYPTAEKLYMSSILVQLVAYDAFGRPIAGSDVYNLTSTFGTRRGGSDGRQTINIIPVPSDYDYSIPYGNTFVTETRGFAPRDGRYLWGSGFRMTIKNVPSTAYVKLLVTKLYKTEKSQYDSWKYLWKRNAAPGQVTTYEKYSIVGFDVTVKSVEVSFQTDESVRTNSKFTKDTILGTDYSPADFLLSYCKQFGMFFVKDVAKMEVDILTRRNFFKRDEVVNIQGLIDRASDMTITPIPFDKKWYKWSVDYEDSEYGEAYEKLYGDVFGSKVINTQYNFNNSTEEVLGDTILKGAVQATERSPYYCYNPNSPTVGAWYYNGFKYLLFDTNDNTNTTDMEVSSTGTIDLYSGMTEYKYYDLFDKVQLHTEGNGSSEGSNVLLFFNGYQNLTVNEKNLGYIISDDTTVGAILNESRPCWLWSATDTDINGDNICIHITQAPKFSRYVMSPATGYITKSWDFGMPNELFVPGAVNIEEGTIYSQAWDSYISDLYNENTRIVECKMRLTGKPSIDWLRRFYFFDGGIYRMLSITDWNMSQYGLTKVKFVKVQDLNNYDMLPIANTPIINLTLSKYDIAAMGETIEWNVTVSDGGYWYMEYPSDITVTGLDAYRGAQGNASGTITFPANPNTNQPTTYTFKVFSNLSSDSVEVEQGHGSFYANRLDPGYIIPAEGGSTQWQVYSETPWTAYTQNSGYASISPSTGDATEGTVITFTMSANLDYSRRSANMILTNGEGQITYNYAVYQEAAEEHSISMSPTGSVYMPASQTSRKFTVDATDTWKFHSDGIGTTDLPDPLNVSPALTTFQYTLAANTGATKYDRAWAELSEYPEERSGYAYVYQMPTFALYYNSTQNTLQPSNPNGFLDPNGQSVLVSENVHREHKPENNLYQPYYYDYEMAFPEAVETITDGAFEGCTGLTSIHCDGVTQIGPRSFKGCTNLTGITMSDVQTIGNNAFEGCEYLGVSLPPNVSSIGADVFSGTTFTEIYYEDTAQRWRSVQKDTNWLRGSNITTVYCTDTDIPASS